MRLKEYMTVKNIYTDNTRVEILREDVKYMYKFLNRSGEYKNRLSYAKLTELIEDYCIEAGLSRLNFYTNVMKNRFPYVLTVNTRNIDIKSVEDSIVRDYDRILEMIEKGTLYGERCPLLGDEISGKAGILRYQTIDHKYIEFTILGLIFKHTEKFSAVIVLSKYNNVKFLENIRKYYDDGILELRALYTPSDNRLLKCEKIITLDIHTTRLYELIIRDKQNLSIPDTTKSNISIESESEAFSTGPNPDSLELKKSKSYHSTLRKTEIKCDGSGFFEDSIPVSQALYDKYDGEIPWSQLITTNLEDNWDDLVINKTEDSDTLEIKVKYHNSCKPIEIRQNGDWIDLCVNENKFMIEGNHYMLPLGVSIKLPDGYEAHLLPRSSTMKKTGLMLANSMGIIDNSYCGDKDEWKASVYATKTTHVLKGDRLFQFRIVKSMNKDIKITEVDSLGDSNRGGFGSTDK